MTSTNTKQIPKREELEAALQAATRAFATVCSPLAGPRATREALRDLIRNVANADRMLCKLRVTFELDSYVDR